MTTTKKKKKKKKKRMLKCVRKLVKTRIDMTTDDAFKYILVFLNKVTRKSCPETDLIYLKRKARMDGYTKQNNKIINVFLFLKCASFCHETETGGY